jgi:putative flippase GtrA
VISLELVRFLIAGGIAACVNVFSRIVLNRWMSYAASILVAFVLGLITAFVINRVFVFTSANNKLRHQVLWFVAINLAAVLQTLAISLLLARVIFPYAGWHWRGETVAHAIGVVVPVITSYLGHKRWTFRRA